MEAMTVTEEINPAKAIERPDVRHETLPGRRARGVVRLLGLSGVAMALVLPIGIYPRIIQSQELDQGHTKIVEKLPEVTIAHPVSATPSRSISLPGTVEAIQETAIYA